MDSGVREHKGCTAMNKKMRFACGVIRNYFRDVTKIVDNGESVKQGIGDHIEDVLDMVGGVFAGGEE